MKINLCIMVKPDTYTNYAGRPGRLKVFESLNWSGSWVRGPLGRAIRLWEVLKSISRERREGADRVTTTAGVLERESREIQRIAGEDDGGNDKEEAWHGQRQGHADPSRRTPSRRLRASQVRSPDSDQRSQCHGHLSSRRRCFLLGHVPGRPRQQDPEVKFYFHIFAVCFVICLVAEKVKWKKLIVWILDFVLLWLAMYVIGLGGVHWRIWFFMCGFLNLGLWNVGKFWGMFSNGILRQVAMWKNYIECLLYEFSSKKGTDFTECTIKIE